MNDFLLKHKDNRPVKNAYAYIHHVQSSDYLPAVPVTEIKNVMALPAHDGERYTLLYGTIQAWLDNQKHFCQRHADYNKNTTNIYEWSRWKCELMILEHIYTWDLMTVFEELYGDGADV